MNKKTDKIKVMINKTEKYPYYYLRGADYLGGEGLVEIELTKQELIWIKWIERQNEKVQEFLEKKIFIHNPLKKFKESYEEPKEDNKKTEVINVDVEELAMELHEAGREAVEQNKTVVASLGLKTPSRFLEWDEIKEAAREGRRIQARYLLNKYNISKK